MPYGLYISAEGAAAQSRRMEVLSNNLANVGTPGFKRELVVLEARNSEAIEQGDDYSGSRTINDIGGGVQVRQTITEFAPGPIDVTGMATDMAVLGEGFFVVDNAGERMLTRAGNFQLSPDGFLRTQEGHNVLSQDGSPIQIDPSLPWHVGNGAVIQQAGAAIPLALEKPVSYGDLAKAGENMFRPLAPTLPIAPETRRVAGGSLELSAVKPTTAMMEMIDASRAFESNVRVIQYQDEMLGSLVNRVLRQQ